ncbi:ankyrin repeat-containing domain protein [Baffinella frigidus]|nr:ankyrin repeat-containing domain protein [Cryptophyta sp. CCMP2293]
MLWAAVGSHTDAVDLLLTHGAFVDARDSYGRTALHYAAMTQNMDLAVVLRKHGADFAAVGSSGHTPLHLAAVHLNTEMATFLLEHGAPIDARLEAGPGWPGYNATALHQAYYTRRETMVRMLLDNGAEFEEPYGDPLLSLVAKSAKRMEQTVTSPVANARESRFNATFLAEPARREALRVVRCEAFAMGHQERLGVESRVRGLDAGVVRMVLDM